MFTIPDLAIHVILTFLDNKTLLRGISISSKHFHSLASKNYLWYERVQNDFPFAEIQSVYNSSVSYLLEYIRYHQSSEGTFLNFGVYLVGIRSNSTRSTIPTYTYQYILQESQRTKKVILSGG